MWLSMYLDCIHFLLSFFSMFDWASMYSELHLTLLWEGDVWFLTHTHTHSGVLIIFKIIKNFNYYFSCRIWIKYRKSSKKYKKCINQIKTIVPDWYCNTMKIGFVCSECPDMALISQRMKHWGACENYSIGTTFCFYLKIQGGKWKWWPFF